MELVIAKIKLILANDIPSKKREGGWADLVAAKIKLILAGISPTHPLKN